MRLLQVIGIFLLFILTAVNSTLLAEHKFAIPIGHNVDLEETKTILLSSPRSGTNWLSCSLLAITRRPVGQYPDLIQIYSSTRLDVDWINDAPIVYRTHNFKDVINGAPGFDKLIFLTRNVKELIFREYAITKPEEFYRSDVRASLDQYMKRFEAYDKWPDEKRTLVFYEDLISDLDGVLLNLVDFINPSTPLFCEDFNAYKKEYLKTIRESYMAQHGEGNGVSSEGGAKAIHYTKNQSRSLLKYLDALLESDYPDIWNKYLKRFETD